MDQKTNFSHTNASDILELERIMNMKKPHKVIKMRNSEKGFLAMCRFPLTIKTISNARQKTTSIKGINKYTLKFGSPIHTYSKLKCALHNTYWLPVFQAKKLPDNIIRSIHSWWSALRQFQSLFLPFSIEVVEGSRAEHRYLKRSYLHDEIQVMVTGVCFH